MKTVDDIEGAVSAITDPERVTRILARTFILMLTMAVGMAALKIAFHYTNKVDLITLDHDYFVAKRNEIEAASAEIAAVREALARHTSDVETRRSWFSITRQSDLDETKRLNEEILRLQTRRARLIGEYNTAASLVESEILGSLPCKIQQE